MPTVCEEFNVCCPGCGRDDQLEVVVECWARLAPDGTDTSLPQDASHDWDDESNMRCMNCGRTGVVWDFNTDQNKGPRPIFLDPDAPEFVQLIARMTVRDLGTYGDLGDANDALNKLIEKARTLTTEGIMPDAKV